jgi:branched-chain amino acid transport system substrate-binding protein
MSEMDLEPTTVEQYSTGDKDFTPQLLSIENSGAEVLIVWSPNSEDSAVILRQIRELDLPVEVIGSASFSTEVTLEIAGDAAEGMYSVQEYVAAANPTAEAFRDSYLEAYGEEPDHFGAWTYDSIRILTEAIEEAGSTDPDEVRDAIMGLSGFEGALGVYDFKDGHDGMHTFHVVSVEDGEFKVIW